MKRFTLLLASVLLVAYSSTAQVNLLPFKSSWKYNDKGINLGTSWFAAGYNDVDWSTGNGKFGYGISDAATLISYGPSADYKYITTYFRKNVSIADAATFSSYTARVYRDDGIVVYVNGKEVLRNNLPTGVISFSTKATNASDNGKIIQIYNVDASAFKNGTNVIAVEVHQASRTSKDLAFDLELVGNNTDNVAPTVSSINRQSPSVSATNSTSLTYRVSFSERVTGVDATDLTLNTISGTTSGSITNDAVAVVGTDGNIYDVTVSSVSGSGTVRLDLKSSGTGIADIAGNAINGGFTSGQTYTIEQAQINGFSSVTNLTPLPIATHTGEKPQAKLWQYAGKHWAVLPNGDGTHVWRLDGTSWTKVLTISPSGYTKADCRVVGNVTHVLLFRGASSASQVVSVEYAPELNSYKLWGQRTSRVSLVLDPGVETATMDVDSDGRMWVASDGTTSMYVRWSDSPYTTWSGPITLATGTTDDDICAVVAMPGKVGVLWSNQTKEKFGFRTHTNGDDPTVWSADEVPASQSDLYFGNGMADDHMNMTVAQDGTLYCAVKTSYETEGYPKLSLLVRRPSGTWDDLYEVTSFSGGGTRPIVLLNEAVGKLKIVYTSEERGGDILYKQSPVSTISFGPQITLMRGNYNFTTSIHQTYTSEVVILATDQSSSSFQAAGVLGVDGTSLASSSVVAATAASPAVKLKRDGPELTAFPNPITTRAILRFTLKEAGDYSLVLYSNKGGAPTVLKQGKARAGEINNVEVDGAKLKRGLYFVQLKTDQGLKTCKVIVQ